VTERFDLMRRRLGEIDDLENAAGLLSWDEETKMPAAGAPARAEQRATLNQIAHDLQVEPSLPELLDELAPLEEELARLVRGESRAHRPARLRQGGPCAF
jgi:carboxypeptidase Taq